MTNVTVFPALLSQDEIRTMIGIRTQIRTLRRMYRNLSTDALQRLEHGARVEPGEFFASIEKRSYRGAYTKRLTLY